MEKRLIFHFTNPKLQPQVVYIPTLKNLGIICSFMFHIFSLIISWTFPVIKHSLKIL